MQKWLCGTVRTVRYRCRRPTMKIPSSHSAWTGGQVRDYYGSTSKYENQRGILQKRAVENIIAQTLPL